MITANPYDNCPIFENENFLIRMVAVDDAEDLLPVYAQPNESVETNSFNCTYGYGSRTLDEIKDFIQGWLDEYAKRHFVRWSVVGKQSGKAIGTIELFNRQANDFFNNCAILRLDLHNDFEQTAIIEEVLALLLSSTFTLFECPIIATKVAPTAKGRMEALKRLKFFPTEEKAVGREASFDGFWILKAATYNPA
ncbi:MAG: GNAT family N-acetyltransferase [Oscillospiraceae bacterium]|jgi:RimJ/RimL family protein N-acetyltransferase|nr:GNAT family N-acetyltransferase [Oscillospiraceae bacterium]